MKKLVYTLGTIASIATPLVAVISCGSGNGNGSKLPTLEKGEYPNSDWFNNVSNSEIQIGKKLLSNGEDLGFRYQVVTDEDNVVGETEFNQQNNLERFINEAFDFAANDNKEQRLAFKKALEQSFQFFYIQFINPKTHQMSATKTIYLPHLSNNITDAEASVYKKLVKAEKISSNPKDIPVTAYDAPSVMNMSLTVKPSDTHIARIYSNGQRYPQLDKDGHLTDRVIEKFLTSTLKADSVSGPANGILGDKETEFHTSFTNELYLSQITSALHVYRDNLPDWILRAAAMVGDNEENGFTVPFGHLPQNPMDFNRMLSSLSTSLKDVKFVHADVNSSLDFRTLGNGSEVYALSKAFGDFDLPTNGKITLDKATEIATILLNNKYINFEREYAPFETAVYINSEKNIADKKAQFVTNLANTEYQTIFDKGEYCVKAKSDVLVNNYTQKYFAGQYVPISVAKTAYNWTDSFLIEDASKIDSAANPSGPDDNAPSNLSPAASTFTEDQTTFYRAYLQISTKWWTEGQDGQPSDDLPFSEITAAIKADNGAATTRQFALKELFEWSAKDLLLQRASLWFYDDANKRVNFQITAEDTPATLAEKLVNATLKKATDLII